MGHRPILKLQACPKGVPMVSNCQRDGQGDLCYGYTQGMHLEKFAL